ARGDELERAVLAQGQQPEDGLRLGAHAELRLVVEGALDRADVEVEPHGQKLRPGQARRAAAARARHRARAARARLGAPRSARRGPRADGGVVPSARLSEGGGATERFGRFARLTWCVYACPLNQIASTLSRS